MVTHDFTSGIFLTVTLTLLNTFVTSDLLLYKSLYFNIRLRLLFIERKTAHILKASFIVMGVNRTYGYLTGLFAAPPL